MAGKVETVNPSTLILNYEIYPRHQIDSTNVRDIVDAINAGIPLPPVVVWRKTMMVVDGFHRVTAHLRLKLEAIKVEFRDYPNEAAALEESIRFNMHGRPLAPYDKARCIQLADQFKLPRDRLCVALGLTRDRLGELEERKIATDPENYLRPIKLTAAHLAGHRLTKKQVSGINKATGMRGVTYVNQVINLIENDLVNMRDKDLLDAMRKLHRMIGQLFARRRAKATA